MSENESRFRCMYCGFDDMSYAPYTIPLPEHDWDIGVGPYGEEYWITTEEVEAYICGVCGAHCDVPDEVMWATDDEVRGMGIWASAHPDS